MLRQVASSDDVRVCHYRADGESVHHEHRSRAVGSAVLPADYDQR